MASGELSLGVTIAWDVGVPGVWSSGTGAPWWGGP